MRVYDSDGRVEPKPSPAWAKAITSTVAALFGIRGTQASLGDVGEGIARRVGGAGDAKALGAETSWRVYQDRKNVLRDVDRMDNGDEYVHQGLNIIADHAAGYDEDEEWSLTPVEEREGDPVLKGLRVIAKDPRVQSVLDDLIARLALEDEVWQIARRTAKLGTYLPEIVIDRESGKVTALRETVPHEVWPKLGTRAQKVPGWIVRSDKGPYEGALDPSKDQELEEWQICPFIFGPRTGFFAMPFLAPARYGWKRLQKIEDNLAIQRLRATDRLVHEVPVGKSMTPDEVKQSIANYKANMTRTTRLGSSGLNTTDSPTDIQTDYFVPKFEDKVSASINVLNPSHGQLGNLTDVYYARERLIAILGVPISYLQITSAQKSHLTASAGVSGVDKQFAKTIRRLQRALVSGLSLLFDIQLMYKGIVPKKGMYSIVLPHMDSRNELDDAKVALTKAQAAVYYNEAFGALPPQLMAELFLKLTPNQQAVFRKFMTSEAKEILVARVKAIKEAAKPKPAGGGSALATGANPAKKDRVVGGNAGSGNQNKSRASRSTEQKGMKQSVLAAVADTFEALHEAVAEFALTQDVEIPAGLIPSAEDIARTIEDRIEWEDDDTLVV